MMQKSFNQLGGMQLDRDARALISHFSNMTQRTTADKIKINLFLLGTTTVENKLQKGRSTILITKEGNFLKANNKNVLTNVPDNVVLTPWTDGSAFVGATWDEQSSRHVFNLGVLQ
ncbi:hypothetical protein FRX31_026519 [Thalictrum thalictroides]|uniref:Uncharacterized protein n=1 Tax=Thalictrum thalictroides TaxID=46969 RepID=A0A7J6VFK2_THATH|nr:hypothetical protein FRX31_026519 [Thalictrum thalictroides]